MCPSRLLAHCGCLIDEGSGSGRGWGQSPLWRPQRRQLRGSSCPQSRSQPPRTIAGWQKVRKTLVPPQGGIKAPYVPGPSRCSCGVTPAPSPPLAASPSAALTAPIHRDIPSQGGCRSPPGALGKEGRGCEQRWTGQRVVSKTLLPPHTSAVIPLQALFCYAITFIPGRKTGFKILFKAS